MRAINNRYCSLQSCGEDIAEHQVTKTLLTMPGLRLAFCSPNCCLLWLWNDSRT